MSMSVKSLVIAFWMSLTSPDPIDQSQNLLQPQAQTPTPTQITQSKKDSVCRQTCTTSSEGYNLIRTFEGYSPFIYKDAVGKPTIGFGHLITPQDKIKEPLLPPQAQELLESDVKLKEKDINRLIKTPLYSGQFDAVVSFTFNLGTGNLKKSTLLKKVNVPKHTEVPNEFHKWIYAGGEKLKGLVLRRRAEAELYRLSTKS